MNNWKMRIFVFAFLGALFSITAESWAQSQPNIILIMADDLGYGSLGCYESKQFQTPEIDQLAKSGVLLKDFHSNGTVCSPTRAALMTGRYQQRCGVDAVITAKKHRHFGMRLEQETVAELLKRAGYRTGMFGKWHLGYPKKYHPTQQGFDEFQGFVSGNIDLFSHIDQEGWFDWWVSHSTKYIPGYAPDKITSLGIDFIKRNKEKPFFLYLAHPAPHAPFQGPNDKAIRKVRKGPEPAALKDLAVVPENKGKAAGKAFKQMVEDLDKQVGRIVKTLDDLEIRENTVVIFCSDNGGTRRPELGKRNNGPLRAGKGSVYEGGHRVPGIINWPAKIKPRVSNETVLSFDLMATFAELAGTKPKAKLDGVSLVPFLLEEKKLPVRPLFWMYRDRLAFRKGPWKLNFKQNQVELFNLNRDISERRNLAKTQPSILTKLVAEALPLQAKVRSAKPVSYARPKPSRITKYKKVKGGDLSLHTFLPPGYQPSDKRPAIVFFFGGGWVGGHPRQFYHQAKRFADLGLVTFCAEYRVRKTHKTSPFESVKDGMSAVSWIRENAESLGVDPNRIVAAGGSAGGHVAACTGVFKENDHAKVSSKPNAMILYNPVLDTTEKGYGLNKVGQERKTEISPCHHVKKGIPPTLLFHGDADKTVPFENAERFHRLMKQVGNDSQLVAFQGRGHGFFNARPTNGKYDYDYCDKQTVKFLRKLKYIPNTK